MKIPLLASLIVCFLSNYISLFGQDSTDVQIISDTMDQTLVEYELVVFEPGFESFLVGKPHMNHYSEGYYKNWNKLYVTEWNIKSLSQQLKGHFQEQIEYDPFIDYGIELEYKLYYFFLFVEEKYGFTLVHRRGN